MPTIANTLEADRHAALKLTHSESGQQVLSARVPLNCSEADFVRVTTAAYGLINKLTGCNCMSGRISFVVEDVFADVIRVNLEDSNLSTR